jgi:hypothetical protein
VYSRTGLVLRLDPEITAVHCPSECGHGDEDRSHSVTYAAPRPSTRRPDEKWSTSQLSPASLEGSGTSPLRYHASTFGSGTWELHDASTSQQKHATPGAGPRSRIAQPT